MVYILVFGNYGVVEDGGLLVEKGREIVEVMKGEKSELGWIDVRDILMEVMWIDWVYFEDGKEFLDKIVIVRKD